jgi:type II secretion system protein C
MAMNELDRPFGKLSAIPWRSALAVLGASFLVASILSTLLARVLMPEAGRPGGRSAVGNSNITVPNPTATLNPKAVDLILKRNLFNSEGSAVEEKQDAKPDQPVTAEAVKSDLPIKLVGTIFGGDPFTGIALIENSQKKSINSFFVGDTVLKEAVVREIYKERIIVDRNGRREYIEIAPTELTRTRRKKKAAAKSTDSGVAPLATEPPPPAYKEDGFERKDKEITMTQAYRQKLLTADFTKVLQDCKATPNMVDGELRGFIITRIRKDSIYEKAGIQNDDIVEEVNGVPLTDTSQAIRLLQSLRNESEIEIRVKRGGSPMSFTIGVR